MSAKEPEAVAFDKLQYSDFKRIADGLNRKTLQEHLDAKRHVCVLIYWDNPTLIIIDPIHKASTRYKTCTFEKKTSESSSQSFTLELLIGEKD